MSESQLHHAIKKTNIDYIKTTAEEADFGDKKFNLICVAQAAHWLDLEKFYGVVVNHLAADGIIALIGYDLVQTSSACDHLIRKLYSDMLQGYWDDERKHIDTNYQNLYFPFDEIDCPDFCYQASWTFEHLIGYLNSWSAVGHYIKKNKQNPIDAIKNELADVWGNGTKRDIRFPVFVRAGKYHSQSI